MKLRKTRRRTLGAAALQLTIPDKQEDPGRYGRVSTLRMRLHGSLAGLKI